MSYIGQTLPADTFQGFVTDTFTGDGTANKTFTLSKTPFNESAILVTIDGVVQEATDDFTVSGTTLTLVGTAPNNSEVNAIHIGGALPIGQAASLDLNGASDQLILDADADTTISADTDDQIDFKAGGTDVMSMTATGLTINDGTTITTADNTDTLSLVSTDADASVGPVANFYRHSSSPAANDFLGKIVFRGENANDDVHDYITILSRILATTDGSETADLIFKDATGNNIVNFSHAEVVYNDDSVDRDFRVEGNGHTHALFVDGGSDNVWINQSADYTGSALQVSEGTAGVQIAWFKHDISSGDPNGIVVQFNQQAIDNNTIYLQSWQDSSAIRARCWSDGDFQNHDGTYGTLSDERIKQNITAANSQWDDIKALQFKNFKKKDDVVQYGADKAPIHLGLIAQEVESVSPNLVKEYAASELDKDTHEDFNDWENSTIKGIKYSILYMKAVKALQEAMSKIETLETKVKALEDA